jgi:tungstate transport system substrate-binding protein
MADRRPFLSLVAPLAVAAAAALAVAGCGSGPERALRIGSTTSLYDTGLLDALIPDFESRHPGVRVEVFAVGSGEALSLGRRGDVDLLLVHSPAEEERFLEEGHGRSRRAFARNDFVLAGPTSDPAGVRGLGMAEAFRRISETGARFVSRGDDSGTHLRERRIWETAGLSPGWDGYEDVGQGMSAALLIAGERNAYVLTDRATLVTVGGGVALAPLVEEDLLLANLYSVIEVTRGANPDDARAFADWLLEPRTLERLGRFGTERYGASLFRPVVPGAGVP